MFSDSPQKAKSPPRLWSKPMLNFGDKRGFTLPLTIVILVVIGFLIFSLYDMVKRERMESFRRYKEIQAELEFESGANYAFYRMQKEGKPWRTDSLQHTSKNGKISFTLSQIQDGAYGRLKVFNHDSSRSFSVRTGFTPASRPALTLLATQANVSLVGKARIEGGCTMQNGTITYSTHYKMRAEKEAFYDSVFSGENQPYFDTLLFFPELGRKQFEESFENEQCVIDGNEIIGGGIHGTASCKTLIMQGDCRCEDCSIHAERLFIRERAKMQNANVTARIISLKENANVSGVFFAQESLNVDLNNMQQKPLRLIVQGRKSGEASYAGYLNLQKFKGDDALVVFMGDNWDETMNNIPVNVAEAVDFRGALVSKGTTDFRGKINGMMIAYNFGFFEEKTLWRGFLRGGQIKGDTTYHPFLPDMVFLGGEANYEK